MTLPSWTTSDAWDTLYLGGQRVPGVSLVNIKLGSGLDVQKPKGGKKATIKDEGAPPAELAVQTTLADIDELNAFRELLPMFRPTSKAGARDPLEIAHPAAQMWGVNVVTVGPIDMPPQEPGGATVVTYTLHEWQPAPVAAKKSKKKPRTEKNEAGDIERRIRDRNPSNGATP